MPQRPKAKNTPAAVRVSSRFKGSGEVVAPKKGIRPALTGQARFSWCYFRRQQGPFQRSSSAGLHLRPPASTLTPWHGTTFVPPSQRKNAGAATSLRHWPAKTSTRGLGSLFFSGRKFYPWLVITSKFALPEHKPVPHGSHGVDGEILHRQCPLHRRGSITQNRTELTAPGHHVATNLPTF